MKFQNLNQDMVASLRQDNDNSCADCLLPGIDPTTPHITGTEMKMRSNKLTAATAAVALCAFSAGTALAAGENAIYSFTGNADGGFPQGGLVANERGDFFGVTTSDGTGYNGVVYELQKPTNGRKSWTQTTLYAFTGGNDGGVPQAGLTIDASGNLFGTTYQFGAGGNGVVFELVRHKTSWAYKVLWSFSGGADGGSPSGRLSTDASGNVYGTTTAGGSGVVGTVFELSPPTRGKKWTETVLYNFTGNNDGGEPFGNVLLASDGNLYGTTAGYGQYNYGTIYRLISGGNGKWAFALLHAFKGGTDGEVPRDGLMQDSTGMLYGTTAGFDNSYGNVFEISTDGSVYNVLYNIAGSQGFTGNGPWQTVSMDSTGAIYGATFADGESANGEIFKLTPGGNNQWTSTVLYTFQGGAQSQYPYTTVLIDKKNNLYGTSYGSAGQAGFFPGNVWQIKQ
jgi:uncharacterized repeat protein (TIGR03803 family)